MDNFKLIIPSEKDLNGIREVFTDNWIGEFGKSQQDEIDYWTL